MHLKPDVVITYDMGPRALSRFQNAWVAVLRANSSNVREVLSAYVKDELEELTEGCHHAAIDSNSFAERQKIWSCFSPKTED